LITTVTQVYLVPVAANLYHLYVEVPDDDEQKDAPADAP